MSQGPVADLFIDKGHVAPRQALSVIYARLALMFCRCRAQGTLQEVHQVMTQNINDILGQGAKLDRMTEMSSMLSQGVWWGDGV